jgi:hypothetical protein
VLNTAAGVLSQPAGLGMQGKSICRCRTVQNLLHMGGFRKKKRDSPVKKKVLEKAGTMTDRAQIRQIQMRFPSEIKSFWCEQERKQEMQSIVTKFLGRWGRGTGSRYVVRYLREIFTLRIENEPVNLGRGRRIWVEGRRW